MIRKIVTDAFLLCLQCMFFSKERKVRHENNDYELCGPDLSARTRQLWLLTVVTDGRSANTPHINNAAYVACCATNGHSNAHVWVDTTV